MRTSITTGATAARSGTNPKMAMAPFGSSRNIHPDPTMARRNEHRPHNSGVLHPVIPSCRQISSRGDDVVVDGPHAMDGDALHPVSAWRYITIAFVPSGATLVTKGSGAIY